MTKYTTTTVRVKTIKASAIGCLIFSTPLLVLWLYTTPSFINDVIMRTTCMVGWAYLILLFGLILKVLFRTVTSENYHRTFNLLVAAIIMIIVAALALGGFVMMLSSMAGID